MPVALLFDLDGLADQGVDDPVLATEPGERCRDGVPEISSLAGLAGVLRV